MNRYALFFGTQYYPCGGMHDFVGTFETIELAKKEAKIKDEIDIFAWWHIVDITNLEIVEKSNQA